MHRAERNNLGKARLLNPNFPGMTVDPILVRLLNTERSEQATVDQRHCLVFWARPPAHVLSLVKQICDRLQDWCQQHSGPSRNARALMFMSPNDMHMNTFEVTNSVSSIDIDLLVDQLMPTAQAICDLPSSLQHRARLVKPQLSIDASGVAITFVPAGTNADDAYTYQHLRRDVYALVDKTGARVSQRYTVPSAHMTLARWLNNSMFTSADGPDVDGAKVKSWVEHLEGVNTWLRETIWTASTSDAAGGDWVIGEDVGLDFRRGTLWYGGGDTVVLGRGFAKMSVDSIQANVNKLRRPHSD